VLEISSFPPSSDQLLLQLSHLLLHGNQVQKSSRQSSRQVRGDELRNELTRGKVGAEEELKLVLMISGRTLLLQVSKKVLDRAAAR